MSSLVLSGVTESCWLSLVQMIGYPSPGLRLRALNLALLSSVGTYLEETMIYFEEIKFCLNIFQESSCSSQKFPWL